MEVIVSNWNEAEKEVEEVGLLFQRKRSLKRSSSGSSSSSDKDKEGEEGLEIDESKTIEKLELITGQVNAEMIIQRHEEIENNTVLPASDPPIPEDFHRSAPLHNVTTEIRTVAIVKENGKERQELYLESVYQKPPTHGFYCPNCKSCIQTVYIQREEWGQETRSAPPQLIVQPKPTDPIRCSSCFSFLIPIGSWLFPSLVSNEDGALNDQEPDQPMEVSQSEAIDTSKPGSTVADLASIPENKVASQDSFKHSIATSQDHQKGQVTAPKKKYFWSNWAVIGDASSEASVPKKPEAKPPKTSDWKVIPDAHHSATPNPPAIDFPGQIHPELVEVKIDEGSQGQAEQQAVADERTPLLISREPDVASSKKWEILKSVVYGGLTESLASLSVVTSAASAEATTLNIIALAIANLIGGLFALGHNLGELKAEKPKRSENQTEEAVDRYNELLGERENFYLHSFIAILSFIVFGLVPPLVYGFSFRESDDKDFKLAAVAGASLLCVTLLSIAKAHIQRPNSYKTYFQTVLYYVSTGAVASVLSYVAGQLVNRLVEKLGWFDSAPNFALQAPGMSAQAWSSY